MDLPRFLRLFSHDKSTDEFKEGLEDLRRTASGFIAKGKFLEAGILFHEGIKATWGNNDELLQEFVEQCVLCFEEALKSSPVNSLNAILALHLLNESTYNLIFTETDRKKIWISKIKVQEELAQRLMQFAAVDSRARVLTNGLVIAIQFGNTIEYIIPSQKVTGGTRMHSGDIFEFHISGPFNLLLKVRDFQGCQVIIAENPDLFQSHADIGWCFAVKGWLEPTNAGTFFSRAADEFAKDTNEDRLKDEMPRRQWSAENIYLWAPYYRALHFLALAELNPEMGIENIEQAARSLENADIFFDPIVSRFRTLLLAISDCLTDPEGFNLDKALREYVLAVSIAGELENDVGAIDFIRELKETLSRYQQDPKLIVQQGINHLKEASEGLPFFTVGQSSVLFAALTEKATRFCQGPISWIHRALESIRLEDSLRRLFVSLFRALQAKFVQNIHGTIEHGRDIIRVTKLNNQLVLEMYQVKVGNIDTPSWRKVKPQLEEMFEAKIPEIELLRGTEFKKIGYLAFNGHIDPIVIEKVSGWQNQFREKWGNDCRMMNIDDIVNFVINYHLMNEFRQAIAEVS